MIERLRCRLVAEMKLWSFGIAMGCGMMLIEPSLERGAALATIGDLIGGPRYLSICPLGELARLLPPLRSVPITAAATLGLLLIAVSTAACLKRRDGTRWRTAGLVLMVLAALTLVSEFAAGGRFHIGPAQVRYIALPAYAVGSALAAADRGYLCALALFGLLWDLSSALFVGISEGFSSCLPVPYWGRLDVEVSGPPAWLPATVDAAGIAFFGWLWRAGFDPLGIFSEQKGA